MDIYKQKRVLIHGPSYVDLSDLLYFDALVYPALIGEFGWNTNLDREDYIKLVEKGLIVRREDILNEKIIASVDAEYQIASENMSEAISQQTTPLASANLPFYQYEMDSRMHDIVLRDLASSISEPGIRITPKYRSDYYSRFHRAGSDEVLAVIFSQVPCLDSEAIELDGLIDFLAEDDTRIKRRRLFSWLNDIDRQIHSGAIKIEHLPDKMATLLDDYTTYIKASELKLETTAIELVLFTAANIISGLTLRGLPDAVKNLMGFKKKEVKLLESELKAPGRELAYITAIREEFGG